MPYVCVKCEKNNLWEGCLWLAQIVTFVKQCKKKNNVKPMGQFSGTHILWTTRLIFFIVGMYGRIYEGHKICEFDRDRPIEIQGVESGELVVPVSNTLVCHMAFLTTDTWLCVSMWFMAIILFCARGTMYIIIQKCIHNLTCCQWT